MRRERGHEETVDAQDFFDNLKPDQRIGPITAEQWAAFDEWVVKCVGQDGDEVNFFNTLSRDQLKALLDDAYSYLDVPEEYRRMKKLTLSLCLLNTRRGFDLHEDRIDEDDDREHEVDRLKDYQEAKLKVKGMGDDIEFLMYALMRIAEANIKARGAAAGWSETKIFKVKKFAKVMMALEFAGVVHNPMKRYFDNDDTDDVDIDTASQNEGHYGEVKERRRKKRSKKRSSRRNK